MVSSSFLHELRLPLCELYLLIIGDSDEQVFSFVQEIPQRIPRGWERAPKSPFGGRHGGRKVWKRYENIPKDHIEKDEESGASSVLADATNTLHAVKRLRLKAVSENPLGGKENKSVKYLATLRDDLEETPKSTSRSDCLTSVSDHSRPQGNTPSAKA